MFFFYFRIILTFVKHCHLNYAICGEMFPRAGMRGENAARTLLKHYSHIWLD